MTVFSGGMLEKSKGKRKRALSLISQTSSNIPHSLPSADPTLGMNRKAAEFMQYLNPVGLGPSLNYVSQVGIAVLAAHFCPRGEKPLVLTLHYISPVRGASWKLGQPVPESNLSSELYNGSPGHDIYIDSRSLIIPVSIFEGWLGRRFLRHIELQRGQFPLSVPLLYTSYSRGVAVAPLSFAMGGAPFVSTAGLTSLSLPQILSR